MESFSRSEINCFSFGLNFRDFLHAHLVLVLLLRSILCFEVLAAFIRFHYRLLYIYHFPCLTVKGRSPAVPYFYIILSYLSESGGKRLKIVSLLLRARSGTVEDRGGEDSHWYGRPRCGPLIPPAQPPLTRLGEPRIQPVPNGGPPATPDEEDGQAEADEKGAPHDGPTSP